MDVKAYFETALGHGVLATADDSGRVNQAIFARPHFMDDGTLAFIMPGRLTYANLQANPRAAYLFLENGPGYKGKRFYLKKIREEQDTDLLYALRRRTSAEEKEKREVPRFLVFFEIEKILPLIGVRESPGKN